MAEALKNVFNTGFYTALTEAFSEVVEDFDGRSFINGVFNSAWNSLELKERMRHTSLVLDKHLSGSFSTKAIDVVKALEQLIQNGYQEHTLELMFFPDYIEVFGLDDYNESVMAFEKVTQITSCEFGIRPFLLRYPKEMLDQMLKWSEHDHPQVRRLSSEGSRPRLPWAMAIPYLKKDPAPILPILKKLKDDKIETVRRSVANSLNDISKDNPEVTINFSKEWFGRSKETDWVIKHACRTLLKQGNKEVMPLFGFGAIDDIKINSFNVLTPEVMEGSLMEFEFEIINDNERPLKLRVEYGLYYMKANGTLSRKVFMISEKEYPAISLTRINRKQSFKPITTRKFHKGKHQVSIIINGVELKRMDFMLC